MSFDLTGEVPRKHKVWVKGLSEEEGFTTKCEVRLKSKAKEKMEAKKLLMTLRLLAKAGAEVRKQETGASQK